MKIFFEAVHPNAKIPQGKLGNAGYDLFACEDVEIPPQSRKLVKTGIKIGIPDGYYGHISDRSGMAYKFGAHCFGKIIDPSYTGEVGIVLYNSSQDQVLSIKAGERPAQIIFKKFEYVDFIPVDKLQETERAEKGFGSSGK